MNPYQGLKQLPSTYILSKTQSSNQHESLSGIETQRIGEFVVEGFSSNQHESLSGIETTGKPFSARNRCRVPINMNPYQGLKRDSDVLVQLKEICSNQHESLSGIETGDTGLSRPAYKSVPINMNPYQGLKPFAGYERGVLRISISCSNQHESLSGIETG